jgi:SAM-dependent methyltransferase
MGEPPVTRRLKNRLKAALPSAAARYIQLKEQARRLRGRRRHLQEIFAQIHAHNLWGDRESASGPGSSLAETVALREELPRLLRRLGARSMLDAPCGDCHWLQHVELDLDRYLGIDIVPELIAANRQRMAGRKMEFAVADVTRDPLPRADLILSRDCLIHFSYFYIAQAIRNFQRSGATWLLTTTYSGVRANHDILSGQWRPIDLQLPPFRLAAPGFVIEEKAYEHEGVRCQRLLGLWRLEGIGKV